MSIYFVKPRGVYGFFGSFRWLSNFHLVPITYDGLTYPTTEHAYQAAKSFDPKIRQLFAEVIEKPKDARLYGQEIELDPSWEVRKLEVMLDITRIKFKQEPLRTWLLETENLYLEETNGWGDKFWGVSGGEGLNHLGKILMQVRSELRAG